MTEARRRPTREWRAAVTFVVGGAFIAFTLLLYISVLLSTPGVAGLVYLVGPLLGAVALLITAFGLSAGQRWASWVATPMLVVLVVTGTASFLFTLSRGGLDLPIAAVLAVWALRAPPQRSPELEATTRRRWPLAGVVLLAVTVVSALSPLTVTLALRPGGLLIAGASDLVSSLEVSCSATDDVVVTFTWAWTRSELWAAGTDQIAFSWVENGSAGPRSLPIRSMELPPYVREANRFVAGIEGVALEIDLGGQHFAPGRVTVTLAAAETSPTEHGVIDVRSRYVHGASDENSLASPGLWVQEFVARCEW